MIELKPCPFCGNSDQTQFVFLNGERVECVCGASGAFGYDEEEAAIAWNTRTKPKKSCKKRIQNESSFN